MGRLMERDGVGSAGDITICRPTREMQEDAWRRNAAPRPLTSWVMGDPAPGQSALDKKRSEIKT